MTEIVLMPPTPADISQMPLLADIQYLEPMGSESLNRKFFGVVPRGIYRGYRYSLVGGMVLRIGEAQVGTAIVERENACITVQNVKPIDLTVQAGFVGYLVLEAIYAVGTITKQVSTSSAIDAAALKLVTTANLQSHHIILYGLNVPAGTVTLLASHINASERMDISLTDVTKVDGGYFVNTPLGTTVIQLRRGAAADRSAMALLDGEAAVTVDDGRFSLGYGNRAGGTLQPAAKFEEAAGAIAKPQGAYLFMQAGTLTLPVTGVVVGEHVRVRISPDLLISGAVCLVSVAGGAAIHTRGGDALAVKVNVDIDVVFTYESDGWRF